MKKVCSKCGEEKEFDCFWNDKDSKDGKKHQCIKCKNEYRKKWKLKNKDYYKIWYNKLKTNPEKYNNYLIKNRQYDKNYYEKNKEKKKIGIRKSIKKNKQYYLDYYKQYYENNKEKYRVWNNNYITKRRKEDELFKLRRNIHSLILLCLKHKNYKKKTKTLKILGCSIREFKQHLESKFQEGMNWDNHGRNGWHIDHIYPVSKARDEEHLLELNHYTNLQPLWEKDNLSKGNRLDWSE